MANTYKIHLNITDAKGNFKGYACNKRGQQDATHNPEEVTCSNCAGKVNKGLVIEDKGFWYSDRIR